MIEAGNQTVTCDDCDRLLAAEEQSVMLMQGDTGRRELCLACFVALLKANGDL